MQDKVSYLAFACRQRSMHSDDDTTIGPSSARGVSRNSRGDRSSEAPIKRPAGSYLLLRSAALSTSRCSLVSQCSAVASNASHPKSDVNNRLARGAAADAILRYASSACSTTIRRADIHIGILTAILVVCLAPVAPSVSAGHAVCFGISRVRIA